MDLGVNTKVIDGKDKAFFWNFQIFGDYFELVTQKRPAEVNLRVSS